jgi:hypothetical protein
VDGLTATSAGLLAQGRPRLVPCTPRGVVELLRHAGTAIEGAEAVVLGRSILVGRPLAALLLGENATVTVCHSRTRDLPAVCSRADILVAAVGSPRLVGAEMVKPGATVIDVGTNRTEASSATSNSTGRQVAGAIAGGGVGPMTIAMLLANTLRRPPSVVLARLRAPAADGRDRWTRTGGDRRGDRRHIGGRLFIVMFLPWFGVDAEVPAGAEEAAEAIGVTIPDTSFNAWESFDFIDLVLLVTIVVAVGMAIATMAAQTTALPVAASGLTAGLGILSTLLVLYRVIDPPEGLGREFWVFIGLIAAGGIAYGGWYAMQEEGTSFGAEADRLGDRTGGGDPPPPPPPSSQGPAA